MERKRKGAGSGRILEFLEKTPVPSVLDAGVRKVRAIYLSEYARELAEDEARQVLQLSPYYFVVCAKAAPTAGLLDGPDEGEEKGAGSGNVAQVRRPGAVKRQPAVSLYRTLRLQPDGRVLRLESQLSNQAFVASTR